MSLRKPTVASFTGKELNTSPIEEVRDFWDRAYRLLREDKEKAKLLQGYADFLKINLNISVEDISKGISLSHGRVVDIARVQRKTQDDEAWEVTLGTKTLNITKMLESTVKAIIFIKDTVNTVSLVEPHVAIALAGVSVFLPVSAQALAIRLFTLYLMEPMESHSNVKPTFAICLKCLEVSDVGLRMRKVASEENHVHSSSPKPVVIRKWPSVFQSHWLDSTTSYHNLSHPYIL